MNCNVTLVFSQHREAGLCRADALLNIIERISPDVIFEELSEEQYEEAYTKKTLNNLESVAIRKYVETRDIPHIPVDTFKRPESYNRNQDRLIRLLTESPGVHSFHYRGLIDQKTSLNEQYGFEFLNSKYNQDAFEKLDALEQKILSQLNQEPYWNLSASVKEGLLKREDVMLDNVYRYSKENDYSNGLMFIGSGHQKSIIQKIAERQELGHDKISWSFLPEPIFEILN